MNENARVKKELKPRQTRGVSVTPTPQGYLLEIDDGDATRYRLAQLDDYAGLPRKRFPSQPPLTLDLRARASADSIPGTWGFGLWNDPFGLSLGFGGNPLKLPALPNAVWFFHASPENHLSFKGLQTGPEQVSPGNGFLAQSFCSPRFHPMLAAVGLTLPFSRKTARQLMSRIVAEDSIRISADVTQWHAYRLEWSPTRCAFWVDDVLVLETSISPRPPLGLVIWIDNQYAFWRPDGNLGLGVLAGGKAWLEIENLVLT